MLVYYLLDLRKWHVGRECQTLLRHVPDCAKLVRTSDQRLMKIGTPEQYPPPSDWKSSCGGVYPWGCQGDCQTEKGMYWKGEKHTCGSWPGWACELQCHYDPPKTSCP